MDSVWKEGLLFESGNGSACFLCIFHFDWQPMKRRSTQSRKKFWTINLASSIFPWMLNAELPEESKKPVRITIAFWREKPIFFLSPISCEVKNLLSPNGPFPSWEYLAVARFELDKCCLRIERGTIGANTPYKLFQTPTNDFIDI